MKKLLLISSFIISLTGCASMSDPAVVKANTHVQYDKYSGSVSVTGATITPFTFPNILHYLLQANFSQEKESIILYVSYWSQTGWSFFDSARDSNANELKVTKIDSEVNTNATVEEKVMIILSKDYLIKNKEKGLDIKLQGRRGSEVLKVSPEYITGFLDKLEEAKK